MRRTRASCGHFHLQEERAAEFGIALLERVLDARGRIRKEGMELVGNRLTSGEEHAEACVEPSGQSQRLLGTKKRARRPLRTKRSSGAAR